MMRAWLFALPVLFLCCHNVANAPSRAEQIEAAKKAFAVADLNGDGFISLGEWQFWGRKTAQTLPDSGAARQDYVRRWENEYKRMDKNGDGNVNLTEYSSVDDCTQKVCQQR